MGKTLHVLIVEDSDDDVLLLVRALRQGGYEPIYERVDTPAAMRAALDRQPWDIVISDYAMPRFSGMDALSVLHERELDLPFILVSGTIGEESAAAAMRAGAHDYVMKGNLTRLAPAVARELHDAEMRRAHRRAEEQRRLAEVKYRTLVEHIPAITYIAAPDKTSSTLYVSPQIEAILGFSQTEWMADPGRWLKQLHPHDIDRVLADLARSQSDDKPISSEFRLLARNGRVVWFRDEATLVRDEAGQPLYLQGVMLDITERKQAEEALKAERALLAQRVSERTADLSLANAELARVARLKDEFLASMSHELRTPLNAILGLSEALQEQIYGPLNEAYLKATQSIEESGRHLLELINDILDLAKIEARKVDLDLGEVDIAAVCQASLRLIQQTAFKNQIRVAFNIDHKVSTIWADGRRLKQILVNLLSNAVKFTPTGGSIGLEVIGDEARQAVHLTVWDTGIGVAKEDLERLFQPFVQLDSRLARQYSGTGLGLALVYRMVELHGGSITVVSEPGFGSRFTVALPWREPSASQADRPAGTPGFNAHDQQPGAAGAAGQVGTTAALTILLAEDNEANIAMFVDYLQSKGYQVVIARNGMEAIERAGDAQPDIILMDIQMPELDGLEAIQRIRTVPALANTPIIALTALAMPGDRERCFAAGANDYLTKPVSLSGLVAAIEAQRAAGRSRPESLR